MAAVCSQDHTRLLRGLLEQRVRLADSSDSKWGEESIAWKAIARLSNQVATTSSSFGPLTERVARIIQEDSSSAKLFDLR